MPPCLTLSIIRNGSRVKWSNRGKEVAPFPTSWCSSYRKRSLWVTLDYGCQLVCLLLFFIGTLTFAVSRLSRKQNKHLFRKEVAPQQFSVIKFTIDLILPLNQCSQNCVNKKYINDYFDNQIMKILSEIPCKYIK